MDRPSGTVTFLFTDMENSTAAWDGHYSAMSIAQTRHDEIVRTAIGRGSGYIFSTGGDGVAAAFQSARAAVTAAAEIQRAIGDEVWPVPLQIRVRMGMHTGEAIERDGDYFGPAVIKAARLMSLVDGGRVACSAATAELVLVHLAADLELLSVGTVHLKGLSRAEPVFVLAGAGLLEQGAPLEARGPMRAAPIASSRLIGRSSELDVVVNALDQHRLVTLTGMGGIGKTRLAQAVVEAVADRFAGVAWADLASAQDRSAAVYEIAMAVGVRPQSGEELVVTVLQALAARELLLVLDNCEHLRADVADVVQQISAHVAGATVLATSRERLGGSAERVIALGPLDTADAGGALALLVDRLDGTEAVDHREALDSIVRQVDGIPLAIELAAARCRILGVPEVASRLVGELRSLADRNQPTERHRTLEQVIAWSYNTLSNEEQLVLRRLSVFAGTFTLESAELTAGGDDLSAADVDDALVVLVDRSLVVRRRNRFRILEPTRQFAQARCESAAELERIRDQHVNAMAVRVAAVHDGVDSPAEAHWVGELDADWADVRLAIRRALDTDAADTVIFLVIHITSEAFRRRPEAFAWIDDAVRRYGDRAGPHRHELLGAGSWVAWTTLDIERGLALGEAAVNIERSAGATLDGLPQAGLIGALNFSARPQQAAAVARTALDRNGSAMSPATRVMLLGSEAISLALAGDPAAASVSDEAVAEGERAGIPSALGLALYSAALVHQLSGGDPVESALTLDRARTLAASVANHWLLGMCGGLDVAATGSNDPVLRLTAAFDAMDDFMHNGWPTHAWTAGWVVPEALAALGHLEVAATWLGACLACGVPQLANTILPCELESALAGEGDPQLWNAIAAGRELTFVELRRLTDALLDTEVERRKLGQISQAGTDPAQRH